MHETAVLLVNLGSPDAPDEKALKPYLTEFLMDERVIDVPYLLRSIIVKGFIVPFRAAKSAAKYKTVWTEEGSPLISHTKKQCALVKQQLDIPVYYSMRYGNPSSVSILEKIHRENTGLKHLILVPLYPHYAMSSYETAVVQVKEIYKKQQYSSTLSIVPPYYQKENYINAIAVSIQPYLSAPFDHLLFSYHGVPKSQIKKSDCTGNHCLKSDNCCEVDSAAHEFCYRHQVITTTHLVAKQLGLTNNQFSVSFQSRLGKDAWIPPFTTEQLKSFPANGIKKLLIVCPAFVSDCLETLEEIAEEGKEDFLHAGGESFTMIPALNQNKEWIDCLLELINEQREKMVNAQ